MKSYVLPLVCALAACGGNDSPPTAPAAPAAQPVQAAAAAPAPAAPTPAPTVADGTSNFGTITLQPGFMPDPHTASGRSGGAIDASTWSAECHGFVSQTPDHLFVTSAQFADLIVLAHSEGDLTLVVQRPDGTFLCNDDLSAEDGTDPGVRGTFAPGTYKIWVGSYEQGGNHNYTVGFTELEGTRPNTLR